MKVGLMGYYGYGNFGDELMLMSLVGMLKDRVTKLYVLTKSTDYQNFKNVEYLFPTREQRIRIYKDSDLIIWGGGTCFYSNKGFASLFYNFIFAKIILKKRFIFLGVGKGKFKNVLSYLMYILILYFSDDIFFRDEFSKKVSEKLIKKKFKLSGDLVYSYDLGELGRNDKSMNNISFNIIGNEKDSNLIRFYVESINNILLNFPDCIIHLLPAHIGQHGDYQILGKIKSKIYSDRVKLFKPINAMDLINSLKQMDFHIGMRLHLCVVADILGVPNIGINYSPKLKYYFDSIGDSKERLIEVMEDIDSKQLLSVFMKYNRPTDFIKNQKTLTENAIDSILL